MEERGLTFVYPKYHAQFRLCAYQGLNILGLEVAYPEFPKTLFFKPVFFVVSNLVYHRSEKK